MITIETIDNPAWYIYRANCISIGKKPRKDWKPTREWCEDVLHSGHSTLEQVGIWIYDDAIRGDVASHIVRHTKGHPRHVVQSMRPDWTGKERPGPEVERRYIGFYNPLALIEMARQRLCAKAYGYTQSEMCKIKAALVKSNDVFIAVLGEYLRPDCDYRGYQCHQKKSCGKCPHWRD